MWDIIVSHLDVIVLAVGTVVGWVWHKKVGDTTDSARTMLEKLAQQVVHDTVGDLDDPAAEANLRKWVSDKATAWLVSHKITGAIANLLVAEAVEAGVTELKRLQSQQAQTQATVQDALDKLATGGQGMLDAFKVPAKPLGLDWSGTITQPEPAPVVPSPPTAPEK